MNKKIEQDNNQVSTSSQEIESTKKRKSSKVQTMINYDDSLLYGNNTIIPDGYTLNPGDEIHYRKTRRKLFKDKKILFLFIFIVFFMLLNILLWIIFACYKAGLIY